MQTPTQTGIDDGAVLLTGGRRPPSCPTGYFLEPTVFINVPPAARIWREEVFGPVLSGTRLSVGEGMAKGKSFGSSMAALSNSGDGVGEVEGDHLPVHSTTHACAHVLPAVATFRTEGEAISRANDSDYGLAGAVISADEARCRRVAHALQVGIVWVNCSQPCFTQAPWGGNKRSGYGRELGTWGLENFCSVKQVTEYRHPTGQTWEWYSPPSKL